jgi:hypothetical protein
MSFGPYSCPPPFYHGLAPPSAHHSSLVVRASYTGHRPAASVRSRVSCAAVEHSRRTSSIAVRCHRSPRDTSLVLTDLPRSPARRCSRFRRRRLQVVPCLHPRLPPAHATARISPLPLAFWRVTPAQYAMHASGRSICLSTPNSMPSL